MPVITGGVGEGANNKAHDAALVQAMLRIVKNAKGASYLSTPYDGSYSAATKSAIVNFQTDNATAIQAGAASKENWGAVAVGGATFRALAAAVPATHRELRVMPGTKTVYLEGAPADANASAGAIRGDAEFEGNFKTLLAMLVDRVYTEHKIVLRITPTGRRRTFAQQAAEVQTRAGPGESNHNFGRAADIGFRGLRWIQGDGGIKTDDDWLNALQRTSPAQASAFWDARDAIARALPLYRLGFERVHLQLFDQNTFSNINSLVRLLNTVGSCKWGAGYKSDFGLGGALYSVGSAKQIWAGNATVSKVDLATALTAKEAAASKKVFRDADITIQQIIAMQKVLKADFEAADKNWLKWTKVH
jgi:NAD(P)H-dependent FMN reductase